jgi:hypothetical protein
MACGTSAPATKAYALTFGRHSDEKTDGQLEQLGAVTDPQLSRKREE